MTRLQWNSLPNKELSVDQQAAIREWTRMVDQLITRNSSLVHFVSIFGLEKAGNFVTADALQPST
jgi:pyrimidine operon attenuation protein/uracil phosphoribosyltransferase